MIYIAGVVLAKLAAIQVSVCRKNGSSDNRVGAGIKQTDVTKQRSRHIEGTQWEKRYRNGLCRIGEYYVGRPVVRTVQETYTQTEFEMQPDKASTTFMVRFPLYRPCDWPARDPGWPRGDTCKNG